MGLLKEFIVIFPGIFNEVLVGTVGGLAAVLAGGAPPPGLGGLHPARKSRGGSPAGWALCPPYWLEATSFMIWVICVAAMEILFGDPIGALPRVKPLASISQ